MVTFSDSRIVEASGLACSVSTADRVYVTNDDDPGGTAPLIFTVQITTGNTLGTCRVSGHTLVDIESLSMDAQGRLWVADFGDNDADRTDCAIYMRAEPGDGNKGAIAFARFPITYPDGAHNAEAFAIQPVTNDRYIITKEASSRVYRLPAGLSQSSANVPTKVTNRGTPIDLGPLVTDACFTKDGRFLLTRRKDELTTVYVHRPTGTTWDQVGTITVTSLPKPEAIAMTRDGKSFVITEDKGSAGAALITLPLPTQWQPIKPTVSPAPSPTPAPVAAIPSGDC